MALPLLSLALYKHAAVIVLLLAWLPTTSSTFALSPFGPQVVKDTHSAKRVSDEADDIEQAVAEDAAHKSAQVGSPLSKHAVSHVCTA